MRWNHNAGFNVHSKGKINGANGDQIEKVARYMSRATISVERVKFNYDIYHKTRVLPQLINYNYD